MSDYLPPELIPNILTRLPVDTLLRCTSVCKSWYSLITSPSFISSHLNLSNPNNETRLLIRYTTPSKNESTIDEDRYVVHRDNETFDEIAKLDCPLTSENWLFRIIASFNGLFCCSDSRMETIMLWNPALRKSLTLPASRVIYASRDCYEHCIGFGFLPKTDDYKIVRISYLVVPSGLKSPPEVEIFELSTCSWHNVSSGNFPYVINNYTQQAFLTGIVHWTASNPNKVPGTFETLIVSFDMTSEKFGALMVPNCLQNDWHVILSTFRESLSLIHSRDNICSVWVMKEYGVADSWEKQFNIDLEQHNLRRPLYVRENGDIFFLDKYGYSVFDSSTLVCYDPMKNQVKHVGVSEKAHSFHVYTYVESLVLIKGSNEVLGRLSQSSCHCKDDKISLKV